MLKNDNFLRNFENIVNFIIISGKTDVQLGNPTDHTVWLDCVLGDSA